MSAEPAARSRRAARRAAAGRDPRAACRSAPPARARRRVRAVAARAAHRARLRLVRMVGHGSSDNAASYGVYAFGLLPGWTALRDSISLSVYYGAAGRRRPARRVVALSQSGQTPDVLEYVERARAARRAHDRRSRTSRAPRSPTAAEAVLPLAAGPELAVAATKTYTNQVAALALLAGHAAGRGRELVRRRSGAPPTCSRSSCPSLERRVSELAVSLAFVGRMFVIGRGTGVRDRARDLAEAARDVPRRRRAADRDRPRARAGRRDRRPLPGLDDRLGGREPARRAGGGGARPRGRRDADRERRPPRREIAAAAHYLPVPAPPLPAADAAPLGRAGPAARLGARAGTRARPRPPHRADKVTLAL